MSLCLCLPLSAVVLSVTPSPLYRMSPDQADRMFLVYSVMLIAKSVIKFFLDDIINLNILNFIRSNCLNKTYI
jgi:hypothetical protein